MQRIRLSRRKGWRIPPNTIRVSGPSRWDNPYTVAELGRERATLAFFAHLLANPDLVDAGRRELAGKNLACWCPEGELCHADLWLAIANTPSPARPGAGRRPSPRSSDPG